ncbi:RNA pseudouridylate synthase family protein [Acinetobacter baumannii 44467_1]|nr:RNA pseudouridylate synthase family protein [Acinetobacter baumannii 44467_1]
MSDFLSEHLIYRDDDFMVIHKPSDILSVPGKGDLHDSVLTRLVAIEPRTLLIHRLDRDTSGILVFGLSKRDRVRLHANFKTVKLRKYMKR